MANEYLDTGLGWYALKEWLTNEVGIIGHLHNGATPPVQFTCYDPNKGEDMYMGMINGRAITINARTQCFVACGYEPTGNYAGFFVLSTEQGAGWVTVYYNGVYTNMGLESIEYGSLPPMYAAYQGWSHGSWTDPQTPVCDPLHPDIPDPDVVAFGQYVIAGGSPVQEEHDYRKTTAGYSVTAMVRWTGPDTNDYFSPVLISTDQNYTIYSRDGSVVPVPTTEHQFRGLTFYMRKAPLDITDPGFYVTSDFPWVDIANFAHPATNDDIFRVVVTRSKLGVGSIDDDPYDGSGTSEPDAGDGTFDFSSTEIPHSPLPSIGAFDTGMVDVYIPSKADLVALSQYLWAGAFDVENFKKIVADPMDVIIGMQIVPLTAAQIGTVSGTFVVGNISTGVSMPKATSQYVSVDMGTISILPKWGAYLDFAPYSKLSLYLPYIGYVDISPDDCMNGTISVKYYIDIIGGTCVAQIKCNDHVLYQFSGTCACQLPITAGQYQNIAIAAMNVVGSALGSVSSLVTPSKASPVLAGISAGVNLLSSVATEGLSMIKPAVQRSGGFGSSSGLLGLQTPYLILTVPRMCIPGDQNKYIGYPSYVTKQLSDLSGYNSVEVTHLNNMSCTEEEANEIIRMLEGGVIF